MSHQFAVLSAVAIERLQRFIHTSILGDKPVALPPSRR